MIANIIAAGEGSRLMSEGASEKKPLILLDGKPMIERLLNILNSHGFTEFNVITNSANDDVVELLNNMIVNNDYRINIIQKTTESSMHSFYELLKVNNVFPFFLFTVDTVFSDSEFAEFIEYCNYNINKYDGIMAVTSYIDDEKPLYVSTGADLISGFLDTRAHCKLITSGMYFFNYDLLEMIKLQVDSGKNKLRNFLRCLISNELKIGYFEFSKTIDVDHVEDIAKAEMFLREIQNV